jgi:LexA-binding, inner membrane-associated putative hydrolase
MPLDIGIGLILGVLLSSLTALNYKLCLVIGIGACLLPDLDYVWKAIQTRRLPHSEHRDGLHYPLIVVPITGLLGALINPYVGLIIGFGTLLHFIHDSVGIGFGIKWLFPFNKNSYLFLFQIKTPANASMPKQRLYSWNDAERDEMIKKYAYDDWIRYVYFQYNPFGLFEYSFLLLGIVIAIVFR